MFFECGTLSCHSKAISCLAIPNHPQKLCEEILPLKKPLLRLVSGSRDCSLIIWSILPDFQLQQESNNRSQQQNSSSTTSKRRNKKKKQNQQAQLLAAGGGGGDDVSSVCSSSSTGSSSTASTSSSALTTDLIFASPAKRLEGHRGFISDCCLSSNDEFVLSSSWDTQLRLWRTSTGECLQKFVGHTKDVLSCCFSSPDSENNNNLVISGARDGIRIWSVLGETLWNISDAHSKEWCTCVRSPSSSSSASATKTFFSCGYDSKVIQWSITKEEQKQEEQKSNNNSAKTKVVVVSSYSSSNNNNNNSNTSAPTSSTASISSSSSSSFTPVNNICLSPDGSLVAAVYNRSGRIRIFDASSSECLLEIAQQQQQQPSSSSSSSSSSLSHLHQDPPTSLAFAHSSFCLAATHETRVCVTNLETKKLIASLVPDVGLKTSPVPTCCTFLKSDVLTLVVGYNNNQIGIFCSF